MQCVVTLVSGWLSNDADEVLEHLERRETVRLQPSEREAILSRLRPIVSLLQDLDERIPLSSYRRAQLLHGMRSSFDPATPGRYLGGRLRERGRQTFVEGHGRATRSTRCTSAIFPMSTWPHAIETLSLRWIGTCRAFADRGEFDCFDNG
jgi:hypothetical protein